MPLSWFQSYLHGRSLITKVAVATNKISYSEKFNITYGTAQGSCLGPLLFILFSNDVHNLDIYSGLILFADDTTMFNSHHSLKYLEFMLRHDMEVLSDWFRLNKLFLNMSQTVLVHFWHKGEAINVKVNNQKIPRATTTKFLGEWLDKNLMWENQYEHVLQKIQSNRHMVKMAKNILPQHCLWTIYFSHIYSHMQYGLGA